MVLTLTKITLLLSLIVESSTVDSTLAVLILLTSFLTLATLSPDCALHTAHGKNSIRRNQDHRTNQSGGWYQVTDNRSSLTDFRYIPVVHNIHSTR